MRTIIYYHKVDGVGFIKAWQDHVQYLDESTGEEKWQDSLKSWEGETEYEMPIPSDPADISLFFPDHSGDVFYRKMGKGGFMITGSGPLKKNGIDVL
jgi:hypothetical protein